MYNINGVPKGLHSAPLKRGNHSAPFKETTKFDPKFEV